MRKSSILLILLLGMTSLQVSGKWFQQKTIYSKALQKEKTYYVGLPVNYNQSDTTKKYPVIVFLHGASITATDMVNSLEPFLDNFLTKLFFDKLFKVIFIIPDGSCEPYKGSFYTNSVLYGNYEDYIVHDLIDEIDKSYNTYNHRAKWSIMGHSMGGYGAMKIALKYPEKFIGVSALSGPLNITYIDELLSDIRAEHGSVPPYNFTYSGNVTKLIYSMAGAFSPKPDATPPILFPLNSAGNADKSVLDIWEKHNPSNLIRGWKGNPAMAIYTYCGELDEFKLAKPNKMFSDSLDKYKLPHTYIQDPNGDHSNSLFTSFPQGLNFLYNVMDTSQLKIATRVNQNILVSNYCIYPNPASDHFFLSGTSDDLIQIDIFNLWGQKIIQIENPIIEKGIDISSLEKGVYLVSLKTTKGITTGLKLIKR
ncbi:MAG: T9SS type A sorting domain-containing protein [Prolixibacteraceae bacterium]|nr:T9SS type A sorting domain-containing protein [Prolixibacteraceae bacterium]